MKPIFLKLSYHILLCEKTEWSMYQKNQVIIFGRGSMQWSNQIEQATMCEKNSILVYFDCARTFKRASMTTKLVKTPIHILQLVSISCTLPQSDCTSLARQASHWVWWMCLWDHCTSKCYHTTTALQTCFHQELCLTYSYLVLQNIKLVIEAVNIIYSWYVLVSVYSGTLQHSPIVCIHYKSVPWFAMHQE
jgi:hypothetical protein